MSSITSIFIARSLLLLFLQILVFNKVVIFDEITVFAYLYSIVYLPITIKKHQLLLFAFLLGLMVDVFALTGAMHAFAAVFLAFMRTLLFRVGSGISADLSFVKFSDLNFVQHILYLFLCCFVFSIVFKAQDYFAFSQFFNILKSGLFIAILSTFVIYIFNAIFSRRFKTSADF